MAVTPNSFTTFLGQLVTNQNVFTTPPATTNLLERTHYSSSGHSGGGYHHHHYTSGKKKRRSIALTALTLLSFLFFLNILQNCIQEHINQMNPTMMVMQMQTMAAIRKAERKGDDGDYVDNITTPDKDLIMDVEKTFQKSNSAKNTENKVTKKGNKGRNREGNKKIEIKPTKTSLFVPVADYEYTQIPVKLQTVERYKYNKKP